jgi:hypothetical protein
MINQKQETQESNMIPGEAAGEKASVKPYKYDWERAVAMVVAHSDEVSEPAHRVDMNFG